MLFGNKEEVTTYTPPAFTKDMDLSVLAGRPLRIELNQGDGVANFSDCYIVGSNNLGLFFEQHSPDDDYTPGISFVPFSTLNSIYNYQE